ncbi:hypothetical protein [Streptomyces sp. NPDC005538]|uniref:hypothetical protein n=1 Tax=Streptomyces sp. NPDC005538 TaxID=3157043 RepID=UPI0033AB147B
MSRPANATDDQKHTDSFDTPEHHFGVQRCAECSWGGYTHSGRYNVSGVVYVCTAEGCGFETGPDGFGLLEADEELVLINGRLYMRQPQDGQTLPRR